VLKRYIVTSDHDLRISINQLRACVRLRKILLALPVIWM
jgi:hypothetical protein